MCAPDRAGGQRRRADRACREPLPRSEARRPDKNDPARRHAAAARAWLVGDTTLALERYAAIVIDRPRDIVALALVQPRNVSERKGPRLRREAG
jgi:hypothetical protein